MTKILSNLIERLNPNQTKSPTNQPLRWNGKHWYFSVNPRHKAISYIACSALAVLGASLCVVGHPGFGVPLVLLSLTGFPYTNIYFEKRQLALEEYIKDFLPNHYGVKKDYSDIPKITCLSQDEKLIIPFNIPSKLASGQNQAGKALFFASVDRKERTINVFTFDKSYLDKKISVIVDNEEILLNCHRKDIGLFNY